MDNISQTIQEISILAIPVLMSLTFHEFAHGWVANMMGDPTAKRLGRLSLNPLVHLDPIGTLMFVVTRMFGWAKPVPVDPRNFKNPRKDMVWVALAGPAMNIILAVVSASLLKMMPYSLDPNAGKLYVMIIKPLSIMLWASVSINVALAVFNFIPIPPLDGGRILYGLLPPDKAMVFNKIEPYGFILLIIFIMSGMVDKLVVPFIRLIIGILI